MSENSMNEDSIKEGQGEAFFLKQMREIFDSMHKDSDTIENILSDTVKVNIRRARYYIRKQYNEEELLKYAEKIPIVEQLTEEHLNALTEEDFDNITRFMLYEKSDRSTSNIYNSYLAALLEFGAFQTLTEITEKLKAKEFSSSKETAEARKTVYNAIFTYLMGKSMYKIGVFTDTILEDARKAIEEKENSLKDTEERLARMKSRLEEIQAKYKAAKSN